MRTWVIFTAVKWLLVAVALPVFRLPAPPIYSSIFLMVALFGHLALEHGTTLKEEQLSQMRKDVGPRWLLVLSNLFFVLGLLLVVTVVLIPKNWILQCPKETATVIVEVPFAIILGWILSYWALTDRAVWRYFSSQRAT